MSEGLTVFAVAVVFLFLVLGIEAFLERRDRLRRAAAAKPLWFEIEGMLARRGRERGKLLG